MEIYQALIEDHRNLIHILERLEGTTGDSSKLRRDLLEDLRVELSSHAKAEETTILGLMKESEEAQAPALISSQDLSDALSILADLQSISSRDDHWEEKFAILRTVIEDHIQEDEERMFPKAKKIMSTEFAKRLGEEFDEVKTEKLRRDKMH